ncbi:PhnO protein [Cronobacter condimenti 1330]|uniref:Aminoalkylphosphonic acid N-acetyltransferase n=1 Tax=Cronobacter condimenti 1330 TaxID=1073999 RepID=K8AEE9_9ENTR|nr:aminoalkylphosphonate N-acetyltransferase [Cronobacter condimenti]ALB64095.1 aminoalkylphosphonic acid N-acetyltransferase [Cronobacter condimenti 1330]CCJ74134.1 PhnO protein [Cronobacter condimenti 1330]
MPDCEIRPATIDDEAHVYALLCELKQATFDRDAFREGFRRILARPDTHLLLACEQGDTLGMISLHLQYHLHHLRLIGEIQELVVMPRTRGTGVGKALLAHAEAIAREAGAELTELSTSVKRHDAHRFYEREGYIRTHVRFTKPLA